MIHYYYASVLQFQQIFVQSFMSLVVCWHCVNKISMLNVSKLGTLANI